MLAKAIFIEYVNEQEKKSATSENPGSVESPIDEEKPINVPLDVIGKVRFNFAYSPWTPVLEHFAKQGGFSLQMDETPPRTFNYKDSRAYPVNQALDLINGVLQFRGYTLVRNGQQLVLVNL